MKADNITKIRELIDKIEALEKEINAWETWNSKKDFYIMVTTAKKVGSDNLFIDDNEIDISGQGFIKFPAFQKFIDMQIDHQKAEKRKLDYQLSKLVVTDKTKKDE